jgi:hypothetical protein
MRYLRLFGAALLAACALGAVVLASASALPTILPETVTRWTGKSIGAFQLKFVGGNTFNCRSVTALEGTIEQPKPLGLFHIHVKECEAELGGFRGACTGLGEESGVILALGSWHLVFDHLGATLGAAGVAILYLFGKVHFTCEILGVTSLFTLLLGGMALCLLAHPTALTKLIEFGCKEREGGGGPQETKYYNEGGTLVSIVGLLTGENETKFAESIELWSGTIDTEGTATALLML